MTMKTVGIIGHGDRFDALAGLLAQTKTSAVTWNYAKLPKRQLPKGVKVVDLAQLTQHHVIFVSTPIVEIRDVLRELGDHITARHAVVHLARNLEHTTLKTVSEIVREETPTRRVAFLTGPMAAEDVAAGHAASGVCATVFPEVHEAVSEVLVSDRFRLYTSSDILGAELAAAYCRVIAMACGVLSELGLGHSLQATLFSRGLAEMGRFVAHRGGKERTTFGLAGSGNLFVDIGHEGSEDFRIGAAAMKRNRFDADSVQREYGDRGKDLLELIASLSALRSNRKLALHLLETCHLMVSGEMDPAGAVQHLMTLPILDD